MSTIAIIPARGGSKRIPNKNIRPFLGRPLIAWSIQFARAYPMFDRVVVSTDSEQIANVSKEAGLDVPLLRPTELATDTADSASVAIHVLDQEASLGRNYDFVALLQPTSPIRRAIRWDGAFESLKRPEFQAAIGLAQSKDHPFHSFAKGEDGRLQRFVAAADLALRTQDLPKAYSVAGNLYLIRSEALRAYRTFIPPETTGVICDEAIEAIDIDTELDWIIAEAVARSCGMA